MKLSLQTRVSLFNTLTIVLISIVSTYLFISTHSKSKERGLQERGKALSYALGMAAQEGLLNENLDLIRKASVIVRTADVTLAQVYSNVWETVDAYPISRLNEAPDPEAVLHFKTSTEPLVLRSSAGYEFYRPISFEVVEDSEPITIGYVRIILSPAAFKQELRMIAVTNISVSVIITLFAILSLNFLIRRILMAPLMSLYRSVAGFKDGVLPDENAIPKESAREIAELASEFATMCRTIKQKEAELIESGNRIQALFDRVEHGIFRLDDKGLIREANNRFRDMFGPAGDLCDIMIGSTTAPDCLKKAVAEKGLHLEEKAIGKRGEEIVISLTLYPEADRGGEIVGFDGYVIDITEKKRIEERLIRAQKMEAVGTLAGGMAHDFNNLLTAVLGYAEIILSMCNEGDQFHKPATVIYEAAKRGADFGKKILSITRKEKMEVIPVGLNAVVETSIDLLRRSIPKHIELSTKLAQDLPMIKADVSQLQQVIINLVINAVDAMPRQGRLSLETSAVGCEISAPNGYSDSGGFVRLSVSDTGVGIDRTTQSKIFDPFFTTKEMGKGTGLGLYIVHSIVSNHGGYINLYSEPQKGTQFNVYFPITRDAEEGKPMEAAEISGSEVILVIDDESDVRELCADMLQPLGYTVLRAPDGSSGVTLFREMKGKIGVVVLDMIMPKMGGSEVFQALKTIDPSAVILLCSGYSQNGFAGIDDLLRRGAAGFIQKPFARQVLASAIRRALSERSA